MYGALKLLHVSCAAISIAGFLVRGSGVLAQAGWVRARWTRIVPHVIDTLLLLSGIGLALHWGAAPWTGWLGAKMAALLAYVVLGSVALKARPAALRRNAFILALLASAWIIATAVSKSPFGPLAWVG